MKTCRTCKQTKDLSEFPKDKKSKGGYRTQCKNCAAEYMRDYLTRNPDKAQLNKAKPKERDLTKRRYTRHGLTKTAYDSLYTKFDGLCWSCVSRKATHIDHDHKCCPGVYSCGQCVRGLLCSQCNTALGLLADNPAYIKKLLQYSLQALR